MYIIILYYFLCNIFKNYFCKVKYRTYNDAKRAIDANYVVIFEGSKFLMKDYDVSQFNCMFIV